MEINKKIDLNSIEEFPPSYNQNQKQANEINQNTNDHEDDFEQFVKNFQSTNLKEQNNNPSYKEIPTQNMKSKFINFNNKEFFFSFIAYSNINFLILSQQKKIGNLYEAEVEEPEFQIDQNEDEEELPPNYEVRCLLGNRFDALNNFISNFIAAFCFNIFEKAEKENETKPKFIKETEESIINKKIRDNLNKDLYFIKNEKSFFNEYVKTGSNILISLDLKIENILNKDIDKDNYSANNENKSEIDEFEISEKTSEFMNLLRKEIIEILN